MSPLSLVRLYLHDEFVHISYGAHALDVFAHGRDDGDVVTVVGEVETFSRKFRFNPCFLFICV